MSFSKYINCYNQLEVKKVNDFSNGAIFCQLLDIIYEGKADISKLDWTTQENSNFSILEQILSRFQIIRKFDVSSNFDKKKKASQDFRER